MKATIKTAKGDIALELYPDTRKSLAGKRRLDILVRHRSEHLPLLPNLETEGKLQRGNTLRDRLEFSDASAMILFPLFFSRLPGGKHLRGCRARKTPRNQEVPRISFGCFMNLVAFPETFYVFEKQNFHRTI